MSVGVAVQSSNISQWALPVFGATALAIAASAIYRWLHPKPLEGFPHNPVTSILGDIPEITRILKNGNKTLYDYYEILVERHGPVTQVRMWESMRGYTNISLDVHRKPIDASLG